MTGPTRLAKRSARMRRTSGGAWSVRMSAVRRGKKVGKCAAKVASSNVDSARSAAATRVPKGAYSTGGAAMSTGTPKLVRPTTMLRLSGVRPCAAKACALGDAPFRLLCWLSCCCCCCCCCCAFELPVIQAGRNEEAPKREAGEAGGWGGEGCDGFACCATYSGSGWTAPPTCAKRSSVDVHSRTMRGVAPHRPLMSVVSLE
mmetsp:Transcript_25816/g.70015  ORF Transcript_25816/g.70015 Transcript_25816/m.70015 type:complete len:202 (+) Transcript_25816:274-879(+)